MKITTNQNAFDDIDNTKAFIEKADSTEDIDTLSKIIKDFDDISTKHNKLIQTNPKRRN